MIKRLLLVALLLPIVPAYAGRTAAPTIAGVDPPNWWIGHPMSEVQLVVRGTNLGDVTLASDSSSVEIVRQAVNAAGTYIIAYARIRGDARPGTLSFVATGPTGSARTHFQLLERVGQRTGFAGLSSDDVIYLVMPDRFCDGNRLNNGPNYDRSNPRAYHGGDFAGLTERLPYLKQLGVTVIWMTPWYDNDDAGSSYHGYGSTDMYGVEEHFGTFGDLKRLVDAAHALGMKVMQDQVSNHVGETHPWIDGPPTATWFNGTRAEHLDNPFAIDSIVNPDSDPAVRRATLEGWFANRLPDLNQNDPEVARYLIQNSLWWVDQLGIDAVREDTLPYAPITFWSEWMTALKAEHPKMHVIGEVFQGDPRVTQYFQGGAAHDGVDSKIDALFDFPLGFPAIAFFSRRDSADGIAKVLDADSLYPNPAMLVPFIGNHDTPRALALVDGDIAALMLAQTFVLTMRGIPQLYYGDEIAMPGGDDPDNRRDFPGGFAGDPSNCFDAVGRTAMQRAVFDNVRRLITLRRAHPALRGARVKVLVASPQALVYLREGGGEKAVVAINNSDVDLRVEAKVDGELVDGVDFADALHPQRLVRVSDGELAIRLSPRTAAVFVSTRK